MSEKKLCTECEYFGSDSRRDVTWYICDHQYFFKKHPEGKIIDSALGKRPGWCPLKNES